MLSLSGVAVVGWLLAASADAALPKPLPECAMGSRFIELEADAARELPEVCIQPLQPTTVLFDSRLARVEVDGNQRFRVLEKGEHLLTLIPSEALQDGDRVRVIVSFLDGEAPESATLNLVVHPSRSDRLVEVSRHSRSLASYQQGEQQARAETRQCREDQARLQTECSARAGLTGLLANGLLGAGMGIAVRNFYEETVMRPRIPLAMTHGYTYRSTLVHEGGGPTRVRLALEVWLRNTGTAPWMPQGAALVGRGREALGAPTVWLSEPIAPGQVGRVVVETEAEELEARGPFQLKLWDESGTQGATFEGVVFP